MHMFTTLTFNNDNILNVIFFFVLQGESPFLRCFLASAILNALKKIALPKSGHMRGSRPR